MVHCENRGYQVCIGEFQKARFDLLSLKKGGFC